MAKKSEVAAAIVTKLEELKPASVKTVTFDKVRLFASDFREHEFPAIQLIDNSVIITHERGRVLKDWSISIEIMMKSSSSGLVSQSDLWDLEFDVERKLWEDPKLGLKDVVHLIDNGSVTDLHLMEPIYFSRIDFTVRFYQALVSDC